MLIALLGMAAFLWTLLDNQAGRRSPFSEAVRLAGLTLMAATSLYAAAWIAFYALPIGVEFLRGITYVFGHLLQSLGNLARGLRDMLLNSPLQLPLFVLGSILVLYTATLFVLTPIVVPVLSLRAWWRSLSGQAGRIGWVRPLIVVGLVATAVASSFVLSNRQPQARAFALLENPPASEAEARALMGQSREIRAGLLNAYLAPFRYISAQGEVRHIGDIYEGTFHIPRRQAFEVQRAYEELAAPLLYRPVHAVNAAYFQDNHALVEEPRQAARLYQQFFDEPIAQAERDTIVSAVRSTWSADQAEAAWQAVDDREVLLTRQEITLNEQGDWADLELHEVYQNQTTEQQEVIYYFNLPESAVITGLWLGASPDKSLAFEYQVAPRGAAQAVYREQTRVMRDPALVEQIGPRQYRLRVYPIPPLVMDYDTRRARSLVSEAPEHHMWLAWKEMVAGDAWSLPQLAYKRNVYWDGSTERSVNEEPVEVEEDVWLPESIPASETVTSVVHRVDLPGGQTVLAIPSGQSELPALPDSLRLAVVVDRSASMQDLSEELSTSLTRLKELSTPENPVDVYLTASPYRGEDPSLVPIETLDPASILFFGGQNAAELLAQYEALRGERQYEAVLVLTDGTGYELGASEIEVAVPDTPVWLVHLGGSIPMGYDDQTMQAIQASGGGVTGDVDTALARLAVTQGLKGADQEVVSDLLDGYLWVSLPTEQADDFVSAGPELQVHEQPDGFSALAARSLVLAEMQRNKGSIDQLETLDSLHALATSYGIVTPYSSMIVLVDYQQQALLNKLSNLDDRYQREVESLGDTTPAAPVPLAGVPEPHEYLLMGLAAIMLIYLVYSRRKQALGMQRI
jgi:putative PEP-CTERM system integral membrane protein